MKFQCLEFWFISFTILFITADVSLVQGRNPDGEAPKECFLPINLAFLLDLSYFKTSFELNAFNSVKNFIKHVNSLLGVYNTHVALITYDDVTATLQGTRDDFNYDVKHFDVAISNLQYPFDVHKLQTENSSRLDYALHVASSRLFNRLPGIPRVLVLLATGIQTHSPHLKSLLKSLENKSVYTLVISGPGADAQQSRAFVKNDEDVVEFEKLEKIAGSTYNITKKMCVHSAPEKCIHRTDILFLIQTREDFQNPNSKHLMNFVNSMANALNVGTSGSRAAVILVTQTSEILIGFNETSTLQDFVGAFRHKLHQHEKIPYNLYGTSRINKAVELANQLFADHRTRNDFPRVVLYVIDQRHSIHVYRQTSYQAIKALQHMNAKVFTIAIGGSKRPKNLDLPLSQRVIICDWFHDLLMLTKNLMKMVCTSLAPFHCNKPVDIVFIAQTPCSLHMSLMTKQFMKDVSSSFIISSVHARFGFITYGQSAYFRIKPNQVRTNEDFIKAIENLTFEKTAGKIDTAAAIHMANTLMLSSHSGTRPGVKKIAVLITSKRITSSLPNTKLSKLLIVTFGKQDNTTSGRLHTARKDKKDVIFVKSFNQIHQQAQNLGKQLCNVSGYPVTQAPVDLVFIVDSSGSVGEANFKIQKKFLKSFLKKQPIGQHQTRIGVVVYSHSATVAIKLSTHYKIENLSEAIDILPFYGKTTRIIEALRVTEHQMMNEGGGRRADIPAIAVLITDGLKLSASGRLQLKQAMTSFMKKGINMITIGVGRKIDLSVLRLTVKDPQNLLTVNSFTRLHDVIPALPLRICQMKEIPPCDIPSKLLFIVDSSDAISLHEFGKMKDFLKSIAMSLNTGVKTQISIVSYGRRVSIDIEFDESISLYDFYKTIDTNITHQGGNQTFIQAMDTVLKIFSEKEPSIFGFNKYCVLFWHGNQNEAINMEALTKPMKLLKAQRVKILKVGIGKAYASGMLREDRNDVIVTDSFEGLSSVIYPLTKRVCTASAAEYIHCEGLLDVVFLVDSSVSFKDYNHQLTFIKRLARRLNISPEFSRAAVVSYSVFGNIVINLNDNPTFRQFEEAIDTMRHSKGKKRRVDRALRAVWWNVFNEQGGARMYAPKVVIVLVGGKLSGSVDTLSISAKPFHDRGIHVLAIGKTTLVSKEELLPLVLSTQDVTLVDSFEIVLTLSDKIASSVCQMIKPKMSSEFMDIAVLMDASGSVGEENFEREKQFVSSLARAFSIEEGDARLAVVSYSNSAQVHIQLTNSTDQDQLNEELRQIPYTGFTTNIRFALHVADTQVFGEGRSSRPYVTRIVILLTDGRQTRHPEDVFQTDPVQNLRDKGIKRVAVGVGRSYDMQELTEIVDAKQHVITVRDFVELQSSVYPIFNRLSQLAAVKKCDYPVAITFILGSSNILSKNKFQKLKETIKAVSVKFKISPFHTTAGVIILSKHKSIIINPGKYTTNQDFSDAVDDIPYINETLRLDEAMLTATALLTESQGEYTRLEVPNLVLVLTDGFRRRSSDSLSLSGAARPLLNNDIRIIAVCIGNTIDMQKLESVVMDRKDVIVSNSYTELRWRMGQVAMTVCQKLEIKPCDNVLDVGFLVDSSVNINPSQLDQVKTFIKLLTQSFPLSRSQTRVGLILYSTKPSLLITYEDVIDSKTFDSIVDNLPLKGGISRLDKALDLAADGLIQVVKKEAGFRMQVRKVLVMVIDGSLVSANEMHSLDISAAPLLKAGVSIFVVSVKGIDSRNRVLSSVLTDVHGKLYSVDTYSHLLQRVRRISKDICNCADFQPCATVADICFMLDSSGSVGKYNFQRTKSLIKQLAKTFEISPEGSHVSVITFSSHGRVNIKLTDHLNWNDLGTSIDEIHYMGYTTRIDQALKLASHEVFSIKGGMRPLYQRIAVLFTDGRQSRTPDSIPLSDAVEPLRRLAVNIVVVGVGANVIHNELQTIASSPRNILLVESFDDLLIKGRELSRLVCPDDYEGN